MMTARPRGPRVILTASASLSMPFLIAARASSLNNICFAMLLDYRQNVVFVAHKIFLAIELDLIRTVFFEQHRVADLDRHRSNFSFFLSLAGAYRDNLAASGPFLLR